MPNWVGFGVTKPTDIRLFRSFSSSCPLRTSHFRYVTYSEVAGDLHAQSRFGRGLGFGFGLGLGLGFEP